MAKQILGKVVPIVKGTYNSSTQYSILDIVEYNGSSYIAKTNVQGQAPTNTTYWQLLAKQGDKPVYKVDYLTDAEMAEIVNDIITDSTNTFNQNVTAKTTAFNNNATDKTSAFNSNATSKTNDFNSNATSKTTTFNNNATEKTTDYNTNASSTKDDFDRNATSKTTTFNDNATSKTNSYNSNATDKTTAYNNNHTDKLGAYNDNASAKTTAFNENASEKTTEFNNNASALQEELDRYKTLENALPHVNGEGESITLNDTAKSPLSIKLEPTELEQATTTGKNLLENNIESRTLNGVTATLNNDKTVTLNGTATADIFFDLNATFNETGTYILNGCPANGGTTSNYRLYVSYNEGSTYNLKNDIGSGVEFTFTENTTNIHFVIEVFNGKQVNNLQFKPMVRLASITDNTYEPFTGNSPSPSPNYPQNIHTISGDNTVKVENKNLFDKNKNTYKNNYVINDNGEETSNPAFGYINSYIPVESNTTYTLSGQIVNSNGGCRIYYYQKNKTFISRSDNFGANVNQCTFTTPSNCDFIQFQYIVEAFNINTIQLEKNSTATTYVPHQEQTAQLNLGDLEYCKIGDYKDKFMKTTGKNILDLSSFETQTISGVTFTKNDTNTIILNGTSSANINLVINIDLSINANQNYTFSKKYNIASGSYSVLLRKQDNSTITSMDSVDYYKVFNVNSNTIAKKLEIYVPSGKSFGNHILNFMIEEGSSMTEYEPYGTNQWYLKKNIRKVVLDGTEDWEIVDNTSYSNSILRFRHGVTNGNKGNPSFAGVLSNYFSGHALTIRDVESIARQQEASALNVFIDKSNLSEETVAGFKTWLSTHNIIAEYITQNSEYELLNNTLQPQLETIYNKLLGYQEQTNISQENNDLAFNIKAKAVYDLNKLVERVTTLENE